MEALCKISKECLTIVEAQKHAFDIVQIIMDEAEHNEGAKIAAMMILYFLLLELAYIILY